MPWSRAWLELPLSTAIQPPSDVLSGTQQMDAQALVSLSPTQEICGIWTKFQAPGFNLAWIWPFRSLQEPLVHVLAAPLLIQFPANSSQMKVTKQSPPREQRGTPCQRAPRPPTCASRGTLDRLPLYTLPTFSPERACTHIIWDYFHRCFREKYFNLTNNYS